MKITGRYELLRAVDGAKDQTYFLFGLKQEQMSRTDFPLGELDKTAVREIARRAALPVAEKPESQEICFVPSGNYVQVHRAPIWASAANRCPRKKATWSRPPEKSSGGTAECINYTVGQRKGLGIAAGRPLYVVELDRAANRVVVGDDADLRSECLRNSRRQLDFIRDPGSACARRGEDSPSPRAGGRHGRAHRRNFRAREISMSRSAPSLRARPQYFIREMWFSAAAGFAKHVLVAPASRRRFCDAIQ